MAPAVDLLLTLRRAGADYSAEAQLTAPAGPPALLDPVPVAFDFDQLRAASDMGVYGRALTSALFSDLRLRDFYVRAFALAESAAAPLRLRLRLDPADPALSGLRWETLHDPDRAIRPLAPTQQVLLARAAAAGSLAPRALPARPQLRALLAVADPADGHRFGLGPLAPTGGPERVREALAELPTALLPAPAARRRTTLAEVMDGLHDGAHVLVLVAHGRLPPGGQAAVYLEDAHGNTSPVTGAELAGRIGDLAVKPLLAVLAVCDSAGDDYGDGSLHALAPLLARAGVPAVIGGQGKLPVELVAALLPPLLRELRRDGQVDRALAVARAALPAGQDWWRPVLYLRDPEARLWRVEEPPAEPGRGDGGGEGPGRGRREQQRKGGLAGDFGRRERRPRAPSPPEPGYSLNPLFVGREAELHELLARLEEPGPVALTPAVSGLGGIGKTQLAAQFAHRYQNRFPGGVFWLRMEQPDAVAEQVASFADPDGLGLDDGEEADVPARAAAVRRAWEGPEPRLLVFDNLEEPALLELWRRAEGAAGC
jgi:hypothetical protein